MLGIILNTTLNGIDAFGLVRREIMRTPYGVPSSPMFFGSIGRHETVVLYRHGIANINADHDVNHLANICALKDAGATAVISFINGTSFSGRIDRGGLALPYDLVDYTCAPCNTYVGKTDGDLTNHPDFSVPYDPRLRAMIRDLCGEAGVPVKTDLALACVSGPRTPTNLELGRYLNDGADVYCMSGMPEAILALERDLPYQHVALVTATRERDPRFLAKMDSGTVEIDKGKLDRLPKTERSRLFEGVYGKVNAIFDTLAKKSPDAYPFL